MTTSTVPRYNPAMSFDVMRATHLLVAGNWLAVVPGSVSVEVVKVWGGTVRIVWFADADSGEGAFVFSDSIQGYRGALA
jgi:hypothetical protein